MKVILNVPDEGYSEHTWWRLFWAYLMKVIPETVWRNTYDKICHLVYASSEMTYTRMFPHYCTLVHVLYVNYNSILLLVCCLTSSVITVPDEGYSEHTWWRLFWAYLMKVILNVPDEGYSEHTWWRLFWAYLMKVIPETGRTHLNRYLRGSQNVFCVLRWIGRC
jgi:hypothetical protein